MIAPWVDGLPLRIQRDGRLPDQHTVTKGDQLRVGSKEVLQDWVSTVLPVLYQWHRDSDP